MGNRRAICQTRRLRGQIKRYLAEANQDPKPFVWTAEPDSIINKVRRGYQAFQSMH